MTRGKRAEKPYATAREILLALRQEVGEGPRAAPVTATTVARAVSLMHGHAHWDKPQVNTRAMGALLEEMSAEFTIIGRTGDEWAGLSPSGLGMSARFVYYALPEHLEAWQKTARARVKAERLAAAREWAKDALAEEFPAEYGRLVQQRMRELKGSMKAPS